MSDLFFAGSAIWFSVPALIGTGFFLLRTTLMFVGGVDDGGMGADVDVDVDFDVDVDMDMDVDLDHGDSSARSSFEFSRRFLMRTSSSGFLNGRGRNSTALVTLKMATLLPMPRASVPTSTAVYPGRCANPRRA